MPFVDVKKIDPTINIPFISRMPTQQMLADSFNHKISPEQYTRTMLDIGGKTYGHLLGSWGGSNRTIDAFAQYIDNIPNLSASSIIAAWKKGDVVGVTSEALLQINAALQTLSVFESIPLIGMFIELGSNLIKMVHWGVSDAADAFAQIEAAAMSYNKDTDEVEVQVVLDFLKEEDYTPLFLPFVTPAPIEPGDARSSGLDHLNIDPNSDGEGTSVIFRMQGGRIPNSTGFHPGTTHIVRAWQYFTGDQSKKSRREGWTYSAGYNKAEKGKVYSFEQFHPALQQCSMLLWQRMMKNSPEMFALDGQLMRREWSRYFSALEMYMTLKKDKKGPFDTPEFVRPMTMGALRFLLRPDQWGARGEFVRGGVSTGWKFNGVVIPDSYYTDPSTWTEGIANTPAPRQWRYGEPGPRLTARGVTEFLIDTQLLARQHNAVDTLTCAYLTDDAPAFTSNPGLRNKWNANRGKLLVHNARSKVDMALVPPSAWRNQLEASLPNLPAGAKYAAFVSITGGAPTPVTPTFPGAPLSVGSAPTSGKSNVVPAALGLAAVLLILKKVMK